MKHLLQTKINGPLNIYAFYFAHIFLIIVIIMIIDLGQLV